MYSIIFHNDPTTTTRKMTFCGFRVVSVEGVKRLILKLRSLNSRYLVPWFEIIHIETSND